MKKSYTFANPIRHILITLGLLVTVAATAAPASAEYIYRGLLEGNQGVLDMRTARFPFTPDLSFNKQLAQIAILSPNSNCALRLNTTNPIPNVGNNSPIDNFPNFLATYNAAPPAIPAGHVAVTAPGVAAAAAGQQFADRLRAVAFANPIAFDQYIVGIPGHSTDEECRDRGKWFNQ